MAKSLLDQKRQKRDIYLGNTQGIVIVEPIATRSLNGMTKNLEEAVVGMKQLDVPEVERLLLC